MSNKLKRRNSEYETIGLGMYSDEKEADARLLEAVAKYMDMGKAVHCICLKCGGDGYAEDESMLDEDGFLIGLRCDCGGRIRRIEDGDYYRKDYRG